MATIKLRPNDLTPWTEITTLRGATGLPPAPLTGTSAPSANATAIGLVYIDTVALAAYMSVQTGTGATDWKKVTP